MSATDPLTTVDRELAHLRWQVNALQHRCNELLFENRALRAGKSRLTGQVSAFMHAGDQPRLERPGVPPDTVVRLRAEIIVEEAFETAAACFTYCGDTFTQLQSEIAGFIRRCKPAINLVKLADGLADLMYVAEGAFITFGIDSGPVLDEVQRSNMEKTIPPIVRDPVTNKILKPAGWTPPDLATVLRAQGWSGL